MPPYEYDNMADSAGSAAQDAYTSVLESGGSPADALSAATEAAGSVMTDMGADVGMVDTMVTSATEGFTSAMEANPTMDPMEAFDAAGSSVDSAFEAEYGPMDGPPTGMESPSLMSEVPPDYEGAPENMGAAGDTVNDPAIDPETGMAPQPPEGSSEGGYDDGPAPMDYPPEGPGEGGLADGPAPMDYPPEGPGEGGLADGPAPMDYPPGGDPASVGEPGGPEYGPATPPPEMSPGGEVPPTYEGAPENMASAGDMPPTDPMSYPPDGPGEGGYDDGPAPMDYPGMDEASSYMDQSSAEATPEAGYDPASVDQPDVAAGDAAIPDPTPDDDTSGLA